MSGKVTALPWVTTMGSGFVRPGWLMLRLTIHSAGGGGGLITNAMAVPDMVGSKVDVARIVMRGDVSLGATDNTPVCDMVVLGLVVPSSVHVRV